ncbi:MAG: DUF480 domain-containing protein [Planctomycetota bacterium]|nr:MAG: DUF480 domain-containing protein [Planctomycetota bacterium]
MSTEPQQPHPPSPSEVQSPAPLSAIERRILGVLMEKARTTPDSYPLTLNALVTGCNQKTSRNPVMQLSEDEVHDALMDMKQKGIVAEVHGAGRVPKFRHLGYDYLNVKGSEAAVMTELLLRGEQTLGDLRSRASRLDPIPDLAALEGILQNLKAKGLIVELTPPGRGQVITHNLYPADELEEVRARAAQGIATAPASRAPSPVATQLEALQAEVAALCAELDALKKRVEILES